MYRKQVLHRINKLPRVHFKMVLNAPLTQYFVGAFRGCAEMVADSLMYNTIFIYSVALCHIKCTYYSSRYYYKNAYIFHLFYNPTPRFFSFQTISSFNLLWLPEELATIYKETKSLVDVLNFSGQKLSIIINYNFKLNNINIKMFGWLYKCWGGMGVTTAFQRARIMSTYADWSLPDQQAISTVISTFKGQNTETNSQAAINSFFAHLQQDDYRKNAAFLLKNLLIMDFTVEQRLFLTKIAHYHNNQFHYIDSGTNQVISSSVKDLISNYYEYIRAKAKHYSSQAFQLVKQQTRQKFMQSSNSIQMLNEINICFKIQNSILTVSDSFVNGSKSPQLIQIVFSSLLKTYLCCFSIVSLALKTFINRIPTLTKYDLQYLSKLANYFSKDYTRNFLLFIQRNKLIENFKTLKYNQLIIMDDKILGIIQSKLIEIQQDYTQVPEPVNLDIPLSDELKIQMVQNEPVVQRESDSTVKIRRKKLQLLRGYTLQQQPQSCFLDYQNFYHESFIIEPEQVTIDKPSSGLKSSKKSSQTQKKKKIYTKLSFAKDVAVPNLKKEISLEESKKFNKQVWDSWENVYLN